MKNCPFKATINRMCYMIPPLCCMYMSLFGGFAASPQEGCKMMVGSIFVFGMFAALCFIMSK